MAARAPVLESVRAAILFARASVPRVAGVLGLVMLLNIAGDMAGGWAAGVSTLVATLLGSLMANAALLRLAFSDEHPGDPEFSIGPQGFQFGRPELRLLGAIGLLMLFAFLAVLFLLLLAFIFTIAMVVAVHGQTAVPTAATTLPPDVQAMLSLLILTFALALLWMAVRICLYPAATVATQRIQVFSTWRLTGGNWWRIFAAFVLLLLPAIVLAGLLEASQHFPPLQAGIAILSAAVNAFVEIPLFCGLYAYLYKRLRSANSTPAMSAAAAEVRSEGLAGPWG
ncbi:hypothetical protein [Caulobacter sp. S45]|uniref:hypothetical protein n=1 Tax=Caulobacter sp. S45 TaxID=1641861 RepID=UPI001576EE79|nr:hypothetical protein [Caulobacter sp. S45]